MPLRILPVLILLALSGPAAAADGGGVLSDQRWRELSFGLSLRQPAGFKALEITPDDALVTFVDGAGSSISVFIRQGESALNLNTLKQQVIVELAFGSREALVIDDKVIQPGGRPGSVTYFQVTDNQERTSLFGHAMMKIDPSTIAVLRYHAPLTNVPEREAVFDAVFNSIELADPRRLDRIRTAWVRAGERWHRGLDRDSLKAAMVGEQWLRIINADNTDIGYARIRQSLDTMMGIPGIHVEVASRIVIGPVSYDTESFFFESQDATAELWSIRTAKRTLADGRRPALPSNTAMPGPRIVTETGIRSTGKITVKREAPGDVDRFEWVTPPTGYLSQVEMHLLPALLPRNRQQEFAFYTYNTRDGEIALRTIQVSPTSGGGYIVRERPAPDRGETVSTYDANGRLIRRQLPDGTVMLPATAQQMRAIWDIP